jgi:hypothetical protein
VLRIHNFRSSGLIGNRPGHHHVRHDTVVHCNKRDSHELEALRPKNGSKPDTWNTPVFNQTAFDGHAFRAPILQIVLEQAQGTVISGYVPTVLMIETRMLT